MRLYLLVAVFAASILYGSTYQQFRFFDPEAPGGATDAIHYIAIADGTPLSEPSIRQYRWLTPGAARLVRPLTALMVGDGELATRLAFYFVNFSFSLLASMVLFATFQALGFSAVLSMLGVCAFASSRVISLATGTPLIDAAYFCFIASLIYLTVTENTTALGLLMPLLASGKETILPFLLLPLLTRQRRSPWLWAGYAAAGVMMMATSSSGIGPAIVDHLRELPVTFGRLLSFDGWHDLQHGFSLLLPLALAGAWLNRRHRRHVPLVVSATVPIAFGLAVLSGNLGRMFFAAFPAVIVYALITIEYVTTPRAGA